MKKSRIFEFPKTNITLSMLDLTSFTNALSTLDLPAKLPLLFELLQSFLCLSHSSGIRPLSRYSGYSERTLFRVIASEIPWTAVNLCLFYHFVWQEWCKSKASHALVADEMVQKKAGKSTHGMRQFYSSTAKKAVNGVNFVGITAVNLQNGETAPLSMEQVIYTKEDEARLKAEKDAQKEKKEKEKAPKPKGRKKGDKNKPKEAPEITKPVYRTLQTALKALFYQMALQHLPISFSYMLVDSAYTSAHYIDLFWQYKLYIISKLPVNVALFFPYQGTSKTKPRKYGDKVDFSTLEATATLVQTLTEEGIKYELFQYHAWRKSCPTHLLNVLTIRATHPNAKIHYAHVFSNDLTLSGLQLKQYYKQRFKIEFNFRDVKQLFGLSKLKNYHPTQLHNMFNLTFCALLFAKILQKMWANKLGFTELSLIDLKSIYKAQFYLRNAINNTQDKANSLFSEPFIRDFVPTDLINHT
jgi:hypothetical protein